MRRAENVVYSLRDAMGKPAYIGHTLYPAARQKAHKHKNKGLLFTILAYCGNAREMREIERVLIFRLKPPLNKEMSAKNTVAGMRQFVL